jgi:hypothetical protein
MGARIGTFTERVERLPLGEEPIESSETVTYGGSSSLGLTVHFPDLPPGATIDEVRIVPVLAADISRPTGWMFAGSTFEETGQPDFNPAFVNNCPIGFVSRRVAWTYPGSAVEEDARLRIFFSANPRYALHKPMFPSQEMRETL